MERKEFIRSFFKSPSQSNLKKEIDISSPEDINPFTGGIREYTGQWTVNEVIHLLKRTMYGATVEDVNYFQGMTFADAVNELVNTVNVNPGEPLKVVNTDPTSSASDPDWSVPIGKSWASTTTINNNVNRYRRESIKCWWLNNMINQPRSIEEKMILFLSNHVTVEFSAVGYGIHCHNYVKLLRKHALGNFKTLIKEVTIDPCMLIYLNGYINKKEAPDENYGRELQELFTLGKGPDSHYTEDDVKAAARVLTGHGTDVIEGKYIFVPGRHDTSPKQFSAFFNNAIINRPLSEGALETDDLVNLIFTKDEVSKNICRRIYRYFVYHDITADTETNIITPLAETFRNNNYELKPVLLQLLKSEHFFDVLQNGDYIKSPLDFTVGMIRECGIKLPPKSNPVLLYKHLGYLANTFLTSIDQSIGDPNNVSGFLAYYQTPFFDKLWVNTDTYIKRQGFADTMINNGYINNDFKTYIEPVSVAARMSNPADPNALMQDMNTYFLRRTLSQSLLNNIKTNILLTGTTDDSYWTAAWNAYINNPADLNNYSVVNTRLRQLMLYFFNKLEEYHLM